MFKMSYYSSIAGRVRMSKEAFKKFSNEAVTSSDGTKTPVEKYLDMLEYEENSQVVILERSGYGYYDEQVVELLARYKDLPGIDMVEYTGEEGSDFGRYYVDIGRWCYVAAEPPPPPKLEEFWYYVEKHK